MTDSQAKASQEEETGYAQVLQASLPVPGMRQAAMVRPAGEGSVLARLFDAEARRHRNAQQTIEHVAKEAILANRCIGVLATESLLVGLEAEREFQDILAQYAAYELPAAMAPTYINLCRSMLLAGVTGVLQASVEHIATKIARR